MPHPYEWAVQGPPIGTWRTFDPSGLSMVFWSCLTLRADGSGQEERSSGPDPCLPILWRWRQPGELWVFPIREPGDLPGPDNPWDVFRYRAGWLMPETSRLPVLMNDGEGGWFPREGFYTFFDPVHLVGRAEG